eukprot:jgi/Tetstr1/454136/TSEL_041055.t1
MSSESDEEAPRERTMTEKTAGAAGREKSVNLFFGTKTELEEAIRKDDGCTAYIILQNDRLHTQAERQQRRIREVEQQRERIAEEAERAERSKTCLRGMLHNQIEKAQILSEITAELARSRARANANAGKLLSQVAVQAALALGAHTATWWAGGGGPAALALIAGHIGSVAAFGMLCAHAARRAASAEQGTDAALAELHLRLAAAEKGTDHLHDIVDEM